LTFPTGFLFLAVNPPAFYPDRQGRTGLQIHNLVEFPGMYLVVQAICWRDIFSYHLNVKTSGEIGPETAL